MNLIESMLDRFPDLIDIESSSHNSFFIMITKWQNESQIEGFETRLLYHIDEENKQIKEFSVRQEERHKVQFHQYRLKIFNCLWKMNKSKQINFIEIDDQIQRDEQLLEIIERKGVNKAKYKKSMEGSSMIRQFSQELN